MPRGINPNSWFEVQLESDIKQYPNEAERPTFRYRYLVGADFQQIDTEKAAFERELERSGDGALTADAAQSMYTLATIGLIGWSNMLDHRCDPPAVIPFPDTEKQVIATLMQIVDVEELMELVAKMQAGGQVSALEKGSSESSPQSPPEPSVESATGSNASTPQPPSAPPGSAAPSVPSTGAMPATGGVSSN